MRHLTLGLEGYPDVLKIRPYPKGFTGNPEKPEGECVTFFFGLKFADVQKGVKRRVDVGSAVQNWKRNAVNIFKDRAEDMKLNFSHVKSKNLPLYIKSQIPLIVKRKKKVKRTNRIT